MSKSGQCVTGYVPIQKPEGIQCVCQKWCVDIGWGEDCKTQTKKTGTLGEFNWPAGMEDFWNLLLGRGKELIGKPLGFSPEEQAEYFGRDFEKLRAGEAGTKRDLTSALSRQGMLGTGTALQALGDLGWQTERGVSDVQRDVYLQNELQKRKDLTDYTTLANTLFGTGVGYNQIREAINAARRGETQNSLEMLLRLLGLFKG
jgi:hypothetical protein